MRKKISLTFLLIAGLVLLVHSITPHHHHNKMVAGLITLWGEDGEELQHFGNNQKDHNNTQKHNAHELSEDCLLNGVYLKVVNDKKFISNTSDTSHIPDFFFAFIQILYIDIHPDGYVAFTQKPYLSSCYSALITHSVGLRAPPIC